ncbi:sce7726 family protein [Thermanaerosceptrum fracticalcis]|nr:sce7726 family protein [Thermanaerosceptrum fracticalcis]
MKTRDIDIRMSLHSILSEEFSDDPNTLIIDELGLCQGDARVDVAVINGAIHGYEIKSESDTLERLPNQIDIYNKILDNITIITGQCHIDRILKMTPPWWGVQQAEMSDTKTIILSTIRNGKQNPDIDPHSLVQLLWRDEALELLKVYGAERGFISKPRRDIWNRLVDCVPLEELKFHVRNQLKKRKNWRSV